MASKIYKREFVIIHGETEEEVKKLADASIQAITEKGGAIETQSPITRIDDDGVSYVMNLDYAVVKEKFD